MKHIYLITILTLSFFAADKSVAQPLKIDTEDLFSSKNPVAELKFEEGVGTYTGTINTAKIDALTIGTSHGEIPIIIFCKATVKDWGMMPLYLDQLTDNDIRYRRPAAMEDLNNNLPTLVYNSAGQFTKREGRLPPTDCENRNIIKK